MDLIQAYKDKIIKEDLLSYADSWDSLHPGQYVYVRPIAYATYKQPVVYVGPRKVYSVEPCEGMKCSDCSTKGYIVKIITEEKDPAKKMKHNTYSMCHHKIQLKP